MCLVLTGDTRLARPERLEEVEGVCRRWTCDRRWDNRKHKHARSDIVTVAVAVSTVAVIVRQLIRRNAIVHVVFVPWCDRMPRKGRREDVCCRCHKSSPGHGAKAIGTSTRMTNSRTVSQPMLVSANRVPISTYRNSTVRIPMISPL